MKLEIIKKFSSGGMLVNGKKLKPFKIWINEQTKKRKLELTEVFEVIKNQLTKLRTKMISDLSHILFVKEDEKFTTND